MTIDAEHVQTVEIGYDELCGALAARDLRALWSMQAKLMTDVPAAATLPWLWRWDTILPLAKRAGELVTLERGGDRRVLALVNPGLNGLPFTSSTLWGAIQYLGAGESAPAHRHSPSAIRFVMVGSGAYTTVNGDACEMRPGDLILTPNWAWHDHNSYGTEPLVWFDGLDLPLVATLESVFFEQHAELTQPIVGRDASESLYGGSGIRPRHATTANGHSPLMRYRWEETSRALDAIHAATGEQEVCVEFVNPLTGAPALPTLTCEMMRLYPGRTDCRRKTGSSIVVVFQGSGQSVIDGQAFDWRAGDILVLPSWAAVDHSVDEQADLFALSDRCVLEALHLHREEALSEPQAITGRFEPR
jgi:gentisate 1,2-dioxygenase